MLDVAFMRDALVASLAAACALSIVGVYLAIRRVAFMGLVLASVATVGAAVAQAFGASPDGEAFVAAVAAVAAALTLGAMPTPRRISAELVVGAVYAAASAATVLILSRTARGDADTLHLLYGNVLAVTPGHAADLVVLATIVIVTQRLFGPRLLLVTFDAEAARVAGVRQLPWTIGLNLVVGVTVAMAVHEVGTLPTFAFLTLPSMASLLLTRSMASVFVASVAVGLLAAWGGLLAAFHLDLPPGPASVGILVAAAAGAAIVGRRKP
jgi:ABC-type Mn2+/Zn2+ transport system permease subunit